MTALGPDQLSLQLRTHDIPVNAEIATIIEAAFYDASVENLLNFYRSCNGDRDISNVALIIMGTVVPGLSSSSGSIVQGFQPGLETNSPPRFQHWPLQADHDLRLRTNLQSLIRNQIPRIRHKLPYLLQPRVAVRPLDAIRRDEAFQKSSRLIVDSLQAFPQMMTRLGTFPPVIHRYCGEGRSLPKALADCAEIAKLFTATEQGKRQGIWSKISAHQAVFSADIDISSKMDIISQIQADLMYILMQMTDDTAPGLAVNIESLRVHQVCGAQ